MPSVIARVGSIPACAGEPGVVRHPTESCGVYPRVCGGTPAWRRSAPSVAGLSPRVRGNPVGWRALRNHLGSIPACAGEPPRSRWAAAQAGVYPRVCGGTTTEFVTGGQSQGLSPRVRGNRSLVSRRRFHPGSIPACAGEPLTCLSAARASRVYPRVCGGTRKAGRVSYADPGLSPRVRGNLWPAGRANSDSGSIPACAGEPDI